MKELSLITVAKKMPLEGKHSPPTPTPPKCLKNYSLNSEINHIRGHKSCAGDLQQARLVAFWPKGRAAFASRALPAPPGAGRTVPLNEQKQAWSPLFCRWGCSVRLFARSGEEHCFLRLWSFLRKALPPWHVEAGSRVEFGDPLHSWSPYPRTAT